VARDRQRRRGQNPGPSPSEPHRENVPGELDHASGEVDEFEAALVAGADGEAADDGSAEEAFAQREETADQAPARRPTGAPAKTGGPRFWNFLKACWAELQRVQWPDRRQVGQATAVVLGFVVIAGAYLGLADEVAQRIVDLII
jgi:preprotein translocase SecE subunit